MLRNYDLRRMCVVLAKCFKDTVRFSVASSSVKNFFLNFLARNYLSFKTYICLKSSFMFEFKKGTFLEFLIIERLEIRNY